MMQRRHAKPGHALATSSTLVAGLLLGCACGSGTNERAHAAAAWEEPPVAVRVAPVERGPVARKLRVSGTLQLKSEAYLSFMVSGVITKMWVDDGSRVVRGQILAALDATQYESALNQSSRVEQQALRDLMRAQALLESGAVGSVSVQNAETAAELARASAINARFNAEQARLVAPDNGVIERRLLEVGEIASPGRPVFHMRSASRGMVVRCSVTDRELLDLQVGYPARVTLDARPDVSYPAEVTRLATTSTAGSGMFEVELQLKTRETARWPAGLTAKVDIEWKEQPSAAIPIGALVDGDGASAAVFVVKEGRAHRVPVKVGFSTDDRAALLEGLSDVDEVIVQGASWLDEGSRVRVAAVP